MNDDQLNDLKQFMASTVGQTEARLNESFQKLNESFQNLEKKVDDGFAGVGEAIEQIHKDIEANDARIDTRLTSLESTT